MCPNLYNFTVFTMPTLEPPHDKNQWNDCAHSEDSDQPGHLPSLIRVFAVRMKKHWILSYPLSAQQRLWWDWVDAQADQSLRWAHSHFVGFVTRRLIFRRPSDNTDQRDTEALILDTIKSAVRFQKNVGDAWIKVGLMLSDHIEAEK